MKSTNTPSAPGAHDVAVIGAGFSGIAAATELIRQGVDDFVIFERSEDIGGTWMVNRYPGAEVDLESHIYSFSFEPHDWTRTHADWRGFWPTCRASPRSGSSTSAPG
ncbi:FAD-dependent oxidoreductase [Aeromicrobium sp. UC242_57]|uniref:FAD-dependent oxidoreductase n=1 Tax=Aeromicrobium sp. UC242_57 TaxID=3374624 RepID=UPI0037B3B1CA